MYVGEEGGGGGSGRGVRQRGEAVGWWQRWMV